METIQELSKPVKENYYNKFRRVLSGDIDLSVANTTHGQEDNKLSKHDQKFFINWLMCAVILILLPLLVIALFMSVAVGSMVALSASVIFLVICCCFCYWNLNRMYKHHGYQQIN
eukprot:503141_1